MDITIRNAADESRTVTAIRLQMVEHDPDQPATARKVRGRYEGLNLVIEKPATIAAGGEHAVHVGLRLSLRGAAEEIQADASDWLDGLSTIVNGTKDISRDNEWYELRTTPTVDGFTATRVGIPTHAEPAHRRMGGDIFTTRRELSGA